MKNLTFHLILILCIGSIYPFQAIAQRTHNDSLNTEKLRADFDTCVVTARKYWAEGDQRQALKHALNALDIAAKSDSIYDDLMALRMVGQVYGILSRMDSAELYLNRAVIIADTIASAEAVRALSLFADASMHMGKFDLALRYHFLSLERAEAVYPEYVQAALHNIGLTYYKLSDYDRSIQYSEKSLELKTKQQKKQALKTT